MIYLITDTHLGHRKMPMLCGRPEGFTDLVIQNCRKMIREDDLLIHLGDVAWEEVQLQRFLQLPGRKILVRGNHDAKSTSYYLNKVRSESGGFPSDMMLCWFQVAV
jgi:calcineurin-like phosphoesterase family protein